MRSSGSAFSGDRQMAERAWLELKGATRLFCRGLGVSDWSQSCQRL
jgi:hypothetical protein